MTSSRDNWRKEWLASSDLQSEFYSPDLYLAFKRAEADGRARVIRGGTVSLSEAEKAEIRSKARAGSL